MLGDHMSLPLILIGKGRLAAGIFEYADEWPSVHLLNMLLKGGIVGKGAARAVFASEVCLGRSRTTRGRDRSISHIVRGATTPGFLGASSIRHAGFRRASLAFHGA
jgi:hypothetical protein